MPDFPADLSADIEDSVTVISAAIDNGTRTTVNTLKAAVIERLAERKPRKVIPLNASAISGPINVDDASVVVITLNANVTNLDFQVPSGDPADWEVWLVQDGTGDRTVTWALDEWTGPLARPPVLDPRASEITIVECSTQGSTIVGHNTNRLDWCYWSQDIDTDADTTTATPKWMIPTLAEVVFAQASVHAAGTTGSLVTHLDWTSNVDGGTYASLYSTATPITIASGAVWSGQALPDAANRILIPSVAGKPGALRARVSSAHTTRAKGLAVQVGLLVP